MASAGAEVRTLERAKSARPEAVTVRVLIWHLHSRSWTLLPAYYLLLDSPLSPDLEMSFTPTLHYDRAQAEHTEVVCRSTGTPRGLAGPDLELLKLAIDAVHGHSLGAASLLVAAARSPILSLHFSYALRLLIDAQ